MELRTPLGRARGLGSAKTGVGHFWQQRITAIALVPLALWFAVSVIRLSGVDYAVAKAWMAKPLNATMMLLTVSVALWHGVLGVQVVIEDYVLGSVGKWIGLIGTRLLGAFLAVFMAVSVLKVAFGG
ncbi:MAG: succinate dehydrogenase, hydrophobic membrane anchor protein [Magnetospirillum sp.]|nr:succinate dehydrogenase, hydrophobic membrane anchor protein [Magnetospirillum sp.]